MASWLRMRNTEPPMAALERFWKREFADQESVDRDGDQGNVRPGWRADAVRTREAPLVTRGIEAPEAVRRRKPLQPMARNLQWGGGPTRESGCTVVVPFADTSYPEIPVLFQCPNGQTIQYPTRGWDYETESPY